MNPFTPNTLPLADIDWTRLFRLAIEANRAMATFEGALYGVPNPEVLLSPLTTREAVLSSKIEGTQATFGEVLRFEAGDEPTQPSRRNDIREIINYRAALRKAQEELGSRPFSLNLLRTLHEILLDSVRGRNKSRGDFRTTQNWIGALGSDIEHAQFVPPAPERVMPSMGNWESYYHFDERDALIQLAIIHAQFEIIHPFLDGNGRLGRILIPLFLFEKGLLPKPMFYISAYFEEHRETYIGHLRRLDGGLDAWHRWIEFFLRAISDQAAQNTSTARAIMELYASLKQRVLELTHSQYAVPLLDNIFCKPIFQSRHIDLGPNAPSYVTISNLLRSLKQADILQTVREGSGRRAQVLMLGELVALCEA